MKWYIIEFSDFKKLQKNGIIATMKTINIPRSLTGCCFPETDMKKAKEFLGIKEWVKEYKTNLRNIFFLSTEVIPEVKIDDNEATRSFGNILREYALAFGKDIWLHGTHQSSVSPKQDEWLHIFPYCAPMASDTGKIRKVFGIAIPSGTSDFVEAGRSKGIELKDPEKVRYGEILGKKGNNLYIYFDITHSFSNIHEILMRKILDQYFSLITDKKEFGKIMEEKERRIKEEEEKKEKEARENYIQFVLDRAKDAPKLLKKQLDASKKAIEAMSLHLTESCRIHSQLEERLKEVSEIKYFEKEFGQEYDRLLANPNVEKVWAGDNVVEVFTKEIVLYGHLIGKFKISMFLNGKYSCENLTQTIEGLHHPHVQVDPFECCFGISKQEIYKLIKKFQFEVAFHKIWSRLNRYDAGNPFKQIEAWPKKGR